jgi:hypothetical protein
MPGRHTEFVLQDLLGAQDGQDLALADWLAVLGSATDSLPPDVPEVSVPAPRPLGCTRLLDIEAGVQRHAMGGRVGPIDGGFAWISHRRGLGLAGKQQRVGVRVAAGKEDIAEIHDEKGGDGSRPGVPLRDQAGDALVELPHGPLVESHGDKMSRRLRRGCRWVVVVSFGSGLDARLAEGLDHLEHAPWLPC